MLLDLAVSTAKGGRGGSKKRIRIEDNRNPWRLEGKVQG